MKSFFKVVNIEDAVSLRRLFSPVSSETVALENAHFRVLSEAATADEDLPPFDRSTMDGYAVNATDTFGVSEGNPAFFRVTGGVDMGKTPDLTIGTGEAAMIPTGGMLPGGADAVVMEEHTAKLADDTIEVYKSVAPGGHVILAGEDFAKGSTLIPAKTRLRAQEIGLLAAFGRTSVSVHRRPRIGLVSTGDEIVSIHDIPGPGKIRDVNAHTLHGLCLSAGCEPVSFGIVGDRYEALLRTLKRAVGETDMVLLSGGSSIGMRDFTIEAMEALTNAEIMVHGISISPGKPTIIGRYANKPVIGLPGHVTSAMVVFMVVVRPFLAQLAGEADAEKYPITIPARITRNLASAQGRDDFARVRLMEKEGARLAEPVLGKSGLINTMIYADGLVRIDKNTEGIEKGDPVKVMMLS